MRLTDCHCHLDFPQFDTDRKQVLHSCQLAGVERLILAAVTRQHWPRLWQLVQESSQPRLYACLGLHPCFLHEHQPGDLQHLALWLQQHQNNPALCAIGETGLDFYRADADRAQQIFYFSKQLELARQFNLPVVLHVRKAHADTLALLKKYRPQRGGMVHAFSGSLEQAREYIRLGFMLGIGGAYSWPQARKLRAMLPRLPLDSLLLETDSPDMAPAFAAGQRNTPANLPRLCLELADLLCIPAKQLAAQTSRNAERLFALA